MNKKDMNELYNKIWNQTMNMGKCTVDIVCDMLKTGDTKKAEAKKFIIKHVKETVPALLKNLSEKDLQKFAKFANKRYKSVEDIAAFHKNQNATNYTNDMFEMAMCKCISAYAKQKQAQLEQTK